MPRNVSLTEQKVDLYHRFMGIHGARVYFYEAQLKIVFCVEKEKNRILVHKTQYKEMSAGNATQGRRLVQCV